MTDLFPGGVGITHLRVYEWPTVDGLAGGGPHIHLCSTELYMPIKGLGRVQTLGSDGYHEYDLTPGRLVWFTPGVIHRLINIDGNLELLIAMQNVGLPEAGDFILTFPDAVLADPAAYAKHASLAQGDRVFATDAHAARARRDLAIDGFLELKSAGRDELARFYERAGILAGPKLSKWRDLIHNGPVADAATSVDRVERLLAGDASHLMQGRVNVMDARPDRKLGVCGTLGVYLPEGEVR
jgi:mannose-6-phosphate isomerase-like protein (cupin superfamily)